MQLSLGGSWGWKQPAPNRGVFAGVVQTSHANRAATKTIHLTAATGSETKAPCSFSPPAPAGKGREKGRQGTRAGLQTPD